MSMAAQTESGQAHLDLRAFLAGSGATVALVAGAVVAFLAVGALLAFDELPFGGGDDDPAVVEIDGARGPERAAAALAGASRAVAESPAAGSARAAGPGAQDDSGDGGVLGATPDLQGSPVPSAVGTGPGGTQGTLGDTIEGAEGGAGNAGVDLPLSEVTGDATRPLDDAIAGLSRGLDPQGPGD